jgi:hypothetical protein
VWWRKASRAIQQHVGGQDYQGGCQKPHLMPHAASVKKEVKRKLIMKITKYNKSNIAICHVSAKLQKSEDGSR